VLVASLTAGAAAIAGPFGIAEAGPAYQVVNTGGVGVRLRNTPNLNDIKGPGPAEGASFELICQTTGEPVGARSNRVWNYISWNGQQGFIPDVYANTPTVANQFVPGVPQCGAPAPSAPAAPATPAPTASVAGDTLQSGQTLAGGQSITSADGRFRLVMQTDGNAVLYQSARVLWSSRTAGVAGARLVMQGDGNLVIYDSSNRPRWASNTPGRAGARFVLQSDGNAVVYVNSTPVWATNTAQAAPVVISPSTNAAVNWARSYVGKTDATGADLTSYTGWTPGPVGEWSGDCYYFAYRANVVAGKRPLSGYSTAKKTYDEYQRRGLVRTDRNPPAGAIVFWNLTTYGHAAVATGQGTVVTTVGVDGARQAVVEKAIWFDNYLGYVVP
jgi:hypothetical protein